jgi:hypothetical protein
VLVGEHQVPFIVHEAVLCASSDYFKTALGGQWQEATQRCVKLGDDVEPILFQLYVQWLYFRGQEERDPLLLHQYRKEDKSIEIMGSEDLTQCYLMGDRLLDDDFKDCVIDALIEVFDNAMREVREMIMYNKRPNSLPFPVDIHYIYANTGTNSPLRQAVVAMWMQWKGEPSCLVSADPPYPTEFVLQLAQELMDNYITGRSDPFPVYCKGRFHCKPPLNRKRY